MDELIYEQSSRFFPLLQHMLVNMLNKKAYIYHFNLSWAESVLVMTDMDISQ